MQKLEFELKKGVDTDSITKKIEDFFQQCPDQNLAEARFTIREGHHNITHRDWNVPGSRPHEIAVQMATLIGQYTSGKDEHFSAIAEVYFPPQSDHPDPGRKRD